jgi:SAM-dependent methyltransferase
MIDSEMEIRTGERFAFGRNWRAFVDLVDEDRIEAAADSLRKALKIVDLSGRTFLDVGCGSGLFSLAAHRLGARVRSFDVDRECVAVAGDLRERFAPDSDWMIWQASALDERLAAKPGRFDVVYSWGVLHHTGDMWRAMDLTSRLVAPDGLFYLSIYNDQGLQSRMWHQVKARYNASGPLMRRALLAGSGVYLNRRKPARRLLEAARVRSVEAVPPRARGMSAEHDLVDWVGGYPFAVAKPEEVFSFVHERGFELRHLKTCGGGIGCNEYVFQRVAVPVTA